MNNAQEAVTAMQAQALEAIKTGQQGAVEAVKAWSSAAAKLTPEVPGLTEVPGVTDAVGDPTAIVDSVYDFAGQLLDLNKEFVHSLLKATQPLAETVGEKPVSEKKASTSTKK